MNTKAKPKPKRKGRGLGIFLVGVAAVGVGAIGLWAGEAKAKDKKPEPEPDEPGPDLPDVGPGEGNVVNPWPDSDAPFVDDYVPSEGRCSVPIAGEPNFGDGQPYNAAAFTDGTGPLEIARALRYLGYAVPPGAMMNLGQSIEWLLTARKENPNFNPQHPLRRFQTRAIVTSLPGLSGAPPAKLVDGKAGACTLRALGAAIALYRVGQWSPDI